MFRSFNLGQSPGGGVESRMSHYHLLRICPSSLMNPDLHTPSSTSFVALQCFDPHTPAAQLLCCRCHHSPPSPGRPARTSSSSCSSSLGKVSTMSGSGHGRTVSGTVDLPAIPEGNSDCVPRSTHVLQPTPGGRKLNECSKLVFLRHRFLAR